MFKSLSERLNNTFEKVIGQGRIKESHLVKTLSDIRKALLEADVSLPVAKDFVAKMRRRLLGEEVAKSLNPGQTIIKIAKEELTTLMGDACSELNLKAQPPVVILMAGLQGSGKTTSTAKLARLLKEKHKKQVMVVSTDIYRPAAIKQLETLAQEIDVNWFPSDESQQPISIAKNAYEQAQTSATDVLIVDTAGRLHIDDEMMDEVKNLSQSLNPTETLFVVDSMTGQDATNTAKAFHDALPLTGVILTKTDGDARGGAALSIRQITDTPIKFLGSGEKTDALEAFHPERMASRILGMGDVLSLIEDLEKNVDKEKADKLVKKMKKGKKFDLVDFQDQLAQMKKLGGIGSIVDKLPGMGNMSEQIKEKINDKSFDKIDAMISSMTMQERYYPDIIKASRKKRIAKGAGVDIQELNKLLKQFDQMQRMMKKAGKGNMMRNLKNMMPPQGRPPMG